MFLSSIPGREMILKSKTCSYSACECFQYLRRIPDLETVYDLLPVSKKNKQDKTEPNP